MAILIMILKLVGLFVLMNIVGAFSVNLAEDFDSPVPCILCCVLALSIFFGSGAYVVYDYVADKKIEAEAIETAEAAENLDDTETETETESLLYCIVSQEGLWKSSCFWDF